MMFGHRAANVLAAGVFQVDEAFADVLVMLGRHLLSFGELFRTDDASSK
jgi:hypothetical protein